jgi:hypothetical protein
MPSVTHVSMPDLKIPQIKTWHTNESSSTLSQALRSILLVLFMPVELSFFTFNLRLTFTRLIFLIITPVVFVKLIQKAATGNYHFTASDVFASMAALWMFIGPAVTEGLGESAVHSGPIAMEYLIAYMSTRVLLTGNGDSSRFVDLLCLMISLVALDGLLDTATGRYFTHELFGSLTGIHYMGYNDDNYRLGVLRAAGTLEHPIAFGFTCAIGLLLAVANKVRRRVFCIGACAIGLIISISSAPQQSALMGFGLLVYSRVFAGLWRKWLLLSIPPTVMMIVLFLVTPTPFGHLFDLLTIDSSTAYFRLYIWNSVGPAILENPFFSVPDSLYEYHSSVDSLWLALSLSYGMPCAILVALSMIGCCSLPTNRPRAQLSSEEEKLGTALGIIIFLIIFMAFTVHFWGPLWILIGLLLGMRAHLGELGRLNLARDRTYTSNF